MGEEERCDEAEGKQEENQRDRHAVIERVGAKEKQHRCVEKVVPEEKDGKRDENEKRDKNNAST
jgi:hypothetical protein